MKATVTIPTSENFPAYFTTPDDNQKHPGIVLIHEVWGLKEHIKNVADRFSKEGYAVLAPDLISHTGITEKVDQTILAEVKNPATRDEAQKKLRVAMAPIMSPEFAKTTIEKLKTCVEYLLKSNNVTQQTAVVGFCFGGSYSYALATEDNRIQAAVPFYGHAPQPLDKIKSISCPIIAFYGEQDHNLVDSLPELENKMEEYGKDFTYKIYPNTGPAFFNDSNPTTYNRDAAEDAWAATLAFLETSLK